MSEDTQNTTENTDVEEVELENIEGETKNEAFLRLVNMRLPKAVKRLRLIQNLASTNYEYTDEQAKAVIGVLRKELDALEDAFFKVNAEDAIPVIE